MAETRRRTSPIKLIEKPFEYKPFSRKQKKVLEWWTDNSPFKDYRGIIADGAIRSGKTVCMSISFVMWAMDRFDGYNFAFCGQTVGSLRRNVTNNLSQLLRGRGYIVDEHRGDNLLVITKGSKVNFFYLFGGRDESSYKLIQGITLAGIMFDEVALMPESFVNQATARCSVEGSKLWFNCNPAERLHWFKLQWINRYIEKQLLYLHFTMEDNLSLSEAKRAEYRSQYIGVFFRRYIEGWWVSAEGVIYDCWEESENSFVLNPENTPWSPAVARHYVACDYGTTNPTVFLDIWMQGRKVWVVKEYYQDSRKEQRQLTPSQHADAMEKFLDGDHTPVIIIDPAAEAFRLELRNRGFRVKEADNEVLEGIRFVMTLISQRRILVEKSCVNFRAEIESYIWDKKAAARGEEAPVKDKDHAMDALRYFCKTVFNRRMLAI